MSEQEKKPDELKNAVQSSAASDALRLVESSFDSLVTNHQRAQLPEDVFRYHFLPFFTGQAVEPTRNPTAEWIGIAGTATSKVDVIGEDNSVLFTVPAMMDSTMINLNINGGKRMKDLIIDYNLHKDRMPIEGARFLQQQMMPKAREIANGHADETEAAQSWKKIFEHYNVPVDPTADPAAATDKNSAPEALEYD